MYSGFEELQVHHHTQYLEGREGDDAVSDSLVIPGGVAALQSRRHLLDNLKVRAVNLGGWLVIEKWIQPSLFDGIPDGDLLVSKELRAPLMITPNNPGLFFCPELLWELNFIIKIAPIDDQIHGN